MGVFLLDALQGVRPKEIGRSAFIKEQAEVWAAWCMK
jgi:hypothetical protein